MLNYQVKIGLAPMRRDVTPRPGIFNWEKAEERGHRIVKYIKEHFTTDKVTFVDLEGINPVDVMYCEADVPKVVEKFKAEKVDAVLVINCNFGNEEICAMMGRELGKPLCIWAPIDDSFLPDGTRYTDSQCGIFGVSRQLQHLHVPFSFIKTCTAYSVLADMGYIISCESDLHGAITMAMLSCATLGEKIPFFGEFTVRHPEDPNGELLWHCGPFAYSLKKEGVPCKNVNMRQWFQVKDGQYTVARMDQDNGKYSLLSGTCETMEGPYTFGTYLWAKFDNLDAWERKLVEGPYIHHMAEIEGDVTEELKEFTKYVPFLNIDTVEA